MSALTAKSPEQSAAMLWGRAIQEYVNFEHRLPETWNDLSRVRSSEYYLNIIGKRVNLFEENYRFLNSAISVDIQSKKFKLIAKGMQAAIPDSRYAVHSRVRLVILATDENSIQPMTISEAQLTSVLHKAGADLNN